MHVSITFVGLGPNHSRPWFARIAGWPDKGPPVLAFGKLAKGSNPPECVVEAQAGDIVRWGVKDKATGQADPARSGFGIINARGGITPCDQDEARAARRRLHPEDAQLAPVAIKGGWKGPKGPQTTGPAQGAAGLAGSQAVHYAALLAAAGKVLEAWRGMAQGHPSSMPFPLRTPIQELAELMPGIAQAQADASEAQDAQTAAETAQEPETPDVGQADEPEEIRPPAPLPVDEDGLPLF